MNEKSYELTKVSKVKCRKILRMIAKLEEELNQNGLVLFSGFSQDDAILFHRETGIQLGHVGNFGVFMGGDASVYRHDGVAFSPEISPSAGNFTFTQQ